MDTTTSSPANETVPAYVFSYRGRGFWIVEYEDGTYQGLIQGGDKTALCRLPGQALQLVKEHIDAYMEGQ